jgi:ABC-2 type transport system permease protein
MAAITVQGLTKRFGEVLAVDQLDFQIDQGTVAGFLGPNGAGKTTTLRMLLGLVAPTAGTATIAGLTGLAMALASSAAVLAVGLPWLRAKGIEVALADPGVAARVAGLAVAVGLFAVLGTGLAALLRNQVAVLVVGLLWWSQGVERVLTGILHQPGLERWLPMGAATALTRPGDGTLPMWAGALVFAAYGLVLALLGGRLVARRDLT